MTTSLSGATKTCAHCAGVVRRRRHASNASWAHARFCSRRCASAAQGSKPGPPKLSAPPAPDLGWQRDARCRLPGVDPELFYHPEGEMGFDRKLREGRAVMVCVDCPVMVDCRRYALAAPERFGVWGALTEGDRNALKQKRGVP